MPVVPGLAQEECHPHLSPCSLHHGYEEIGGRAGGADVINYYHFSTHENILVYDDIREP